MKTSEKNSNIEKFDGSFEKEESGCTIFVNQTVNSIKNLAAKGLYAYLMCRCSKWRVNVKHIAKEHETSEYQVYKVIDYLIKMRLLTRTAIREKGRFVRHHYKLYLRPIEEQVVQPPPLLDLPEVVEPDLVNRDTYKTKNIINKESTLKPFVDFQSTADADKESLFNLWYSKYPNKQKPKIARQAFDKLKPTAEFVDVLIDDVKLRMQNNWKGRDKSKIPHPATYLNSREWEGEIHAISTGSKIKTWDEITANLDLEGIL